MNHRIFVLLFTFICSYMTYGQAQGCNINSAQYLVENQQVISLMQKIYIEPSEIFFVNSQIFVETPKGLMQILELSSDEIGIYYKAAHPQSWFCNNKDENGKRCGTYNTNTYYCEECGKAPAPNPPRKA